MGRWTLTGAALAAVLVLSALLAPPTWAAGGWRADHRRAADYATGRQGEVSFSLRAEGRHLRYRATATYPSASVVKAMLMTAYLRRRAVRRRRLGPDERGLLGPMIRRSDNGAASAVQNIVGNDALVALAARSGMRRFLPAAIWGSTLISAADQSRLFLRLERLLPRRHRAYALRLLATIVPEQRWGIARLRFPGWRLHFKGGWGSGSGAVDHQVALLRHRGGQRVAIAVLTRGSPSAAYARETERGVAARLLQRLRPRAERWRRKRRRSGVRRFSVEIERKLVKPRHVGLG